MTRPGGHARASGAMLLGLLLTLAMASNIASAYSPQTGDHFNYTETINVNNGGGVYSGYTDQTQVTGMEQMNSVSGSNVSASYNYSYQFNSNQGASSSTSSSGNYIWSSATYEYVNGTDNQTGYSSPVYVWFAMDPTLPVGATFTGLNTQFTILSKNYSFQLPTQGNEYVQTIKAEGTGTYQRDDSYGVFSASYTWDVYFDPTTGYIVGYTDLEQDNGAYQGQSGSFTYTDNLYVTSTSYPLALAAAPSPGLGSYIGLIAVAVVIVVVLLVVYAVMRRRRKANALPKHSETPPQFPPPPSPSSTEPWPSKIDLGSQPSEQVVIKEVAMVPCKYCGTLIPSTASTCPYCGAPRQ